MICLMVERVYFKDFKKETYIKTTFFDFLMKLVFIQRSSTSVSSLDFMIRYIIYTEIMIFISIIIDFKILVLLYRF